MDTERFADIVYSFLFGFYFMQTFLQYVFICISLCILTSSRSSQASFSSISFVSTVRVDETTTLAAIFISANDGLKLPLDHR